MNKTRLEAFSDGVIAIIITIMVLELKVPHGDNFAALTSLIPVFLSYVLSFIYIGIYWNNHHHMLHTCHKITGSILWANLHLLFWLSLFPFATAWMGENHYAALPSALYGFILLMAAIAYFDIAAFHHRLPRSKFPVKKSGRKRLKGQTINSSIHDSHGHINLGAMAFPRLIHPGGINLVSAGSTHRESTCRSMIQWQNWFG